MIYIIPFDPYAGCQYRDNLLIFFLPSLLLDLSLGISKADIPTVKKKIGKKTLGRTSSGESGDHIISEYHLSLTYYPVTPYPFTPVTPSPLDWNEGRWVSPQREKLPSRSMLVPPHPVRAKLGEKRSKNENAKSKMKKSNKREHFLFLVATMHFLLFSFRSKERRKKVGEKGTSRIVDTLWLKIQQGPPIVALFPSSVLAPKPLLLHKGNILPSFWLVRQSGFTIGNLWNNLVLGLRSTFRLA